MKTVIHYKAGPYLPLTENWIHGQIKNLMRYQPIVYSYSTENLDIFQNENIKIRSLHKKKGLIDPWIFLNSAWKKIFNFYPSFAFYLIRDKPKLVHAHFGQAGYDFLKLKNSFKLPLITTFYGADLSYIPSQYPEWKKKYIRLFKEGEKFLVEGNHMKKCLNELGCPEEKIIVQHLGIDLDKIEFMPRKLNTKDEEIRILISGSFREKKGIPYGIDAFARVKKACSNTNLKLTIVGDSQGSYREEEEKKKILNTIKKHDLKNCINMLGYQPYYVFIRELYQHHIFIHPSIHASDGDIEGGIPISIIEASASGMPILSTTHCDIPEGVINKKSGYLVPERDTDALAEKLEFLITNSHIWGNMGRFARRHIEKNYNVKIQSHRLEEIYDKVFMEEKTN
jgi:colanic acid/amylovoran biosynthesis glycosyltransferase